MDLLTYGSHPSDYVHPARCRLREHVLCDNSLLVVALVSHYAIDVDIRALTFSLFCSSSDRLLSFLCFFLAIPRFANRQEFFRLGIMQEGAWVSTSTRWALSRRICRAVNEFTLHHQLAARTHSVNYFGTRDMYQRLNRCYIEGMVQVQVVVRDFSLLAILCHTL